MLLRWCYCVLMLLVVSACGATVPGAAALAPASVGPGRVFVNKLGAWGRSVAELQAAAGQAVSAAGGRFALAGLPFSSDLGELQRNRDELLNQHSASLELTIIPVTFAGDLRPSALAFFLAPGTTTLALTTVAGSSRFLRVFWSGSPQARLSAERYAKAIGGTTLEMTDMGRQLETVARTMPWEKARPLFVNGSNYFAQTAAGPVTVFQSSAGIREDSIWLTVEHPTLLANPEVVNINYQPVYDDSPSLVPASDEYVFLGSHSPD